ncbi:nose resistant to fluoxetine protein 6-like [Ostrinia furnacalis]|uniref:nose resistant to fluoxetine protein 6-like n=1 Tax=Ostrinia furnacalis TaxID=93504 RepID=UPI00103E8C46|nr:nose resistant to fluoxetine protein 6-like [Ostrinia furnacalis]
MKRILAHVVLLFTCTVGYVANNVKYSESTTKLPVDVIEETVNKKVSANINESDNSNRSKYMYLEDVLVGLKYQNWTEEELPCLNQTLVLIRSLQNFTLWAVWEWDSVSSQPLGLLSGNRYQLGNFDQCMNPPWMSTYPEVESQYCLAEVSLERSDHAKKRRLDDIKPYENALDFIQHHTPNVRPLSHLTWGACVPSVCQPRSVERLVSAVLARSHLSAAGLRPRIAVSEPCQQTNSPRKFDALFYAFVALMVGLAIICLICTIINARREISNSLSYNVCKAFCLKENSKDLLKMQKDGIEVIYGIRYLTICFIVMCHQAGMLNSGPISNGIGVDKEVTLSPFAIFILHDDVFVDTFFVISGFLMAKTITAYEKLPNIFLLLLKRYIRYNMNTHHTPNVRPLSHLTWGACVPSVCQPRSVERLVSAVLARSHLSAAGLRPRIAVSEPCQQTNSPRKFDALFYAFVALMVGLAIICLICTIINARRENSNSLSYNVCKAFCLKENSKDLLKMQKDGIEVIYGIRYLTICFIVMCHQAGMLNSGPISNGIGVDKEVTLSPFAIFILHDDVFVDTFFVISGFLMAKTITAYEKLPNIFLLLLKRYIRLVVALAVVVFYVCAIFPLTGSGPLWERFVAGETDACRTNWWLNILMLSNYINTDNACIVVSWYIPCDFHLFALTILTYALYKRWRGFGLVCACVLTTASVITPGVVNYVNNLSAVQLFTFDFVANPRANAQFQIAYIKTHTRAAAYIIGFFAGGYFASKKKNNIVLSKKRSVTGACAATVIMLLVMVIGTSYLWRSYSPTEGALYAAANRPVWAIGVVLLILCCSFGDVPLLKSFLCWYPWVPLSRLAYGLYLTHTVLIIRNVGIARNPVYYDNLSVFMSSLSVICLGTFCAFIIWLLAEAPVNNLFMLCLKPRKRRISNDGENTIERPETSSGKTGNFNVGYLQENLKENLSISSKM